MELPEIITRNLLNQVELDVSQMTQAMELLLSGSLGETTTADFLFALANKGETAQELATAAKVIRRHMLAWDSGRADILDTCGTGGDGAGTFNISTATALVVAGAGVPVVKHGNRSASSRSGSADVLAELGVSLSDGPVQARNCLDRAGLAFCYAPNYHPALKHLGPIRRRLGIPTIFNRLGPLANPAGARRQLLGVGHIALLDRMAEALALLGTDHAMVVCSLDGLDEVSLGAPTLVREIRNGNIQELTWQAADFDLEPVHLTELSAADPPASAGIIEKIMAGQDGPALRIILANSAAALVAADRVGNLRAGVELSRQAIFSGKALQVLHLLRQSAA